ncbi:MAG: FKBP-type peptidyl-prolyl cis-trans isomerase [Verrucomicrobia bacterium]|nr:FKBP-type peptidyl-prolyl cis-trans isomerase [Verrucomicrobiota bacterium]
MKPYLVTALALSLAATGLAADKPDLKDPKTRAGYAIGLDIGSNFKKNEVDVDGKALAAGIVDALAGKPAMNEEEMKAALAAFRQEMMTKMMAKQQASGDVNLKAGEAFLAANAKKDGVKTTASGLQYKVMKAGNGKGKAPKATDTMKVHYHGTLIDGTVFDSSVDRKEPIEFPLNGVIPGWTEGVQLMKEGDKFQFFIPAKLAYGERGAGEKIGPNAALVFEVELLNVIGTN